jgi:tetratricopeptide (TPR) repeat protein
MDPLRAAGASLPYSSSRFATPGILGLLIASAALAVHLPSITNGFVGWDDAAYVSENPDLDSPSIASITRAFITFHHFNWHPLTSLSYGLDHAIWGLDPKGYHLTNTLLHAANVYLVVILAARLFGAARQRSRGPALLGAAFVGSLFAVHPLHVESVAWISERKDVLYALFWLISVLAYLQYAAAATRRRAAVAYQLSLASFVLSLLSKPMAVSLPFVLLILDFHPLGRLQRGRSIAPVLLEKLPFLAFAIGSAAITLAAQAASVKPFAFYSLPDRLWGAVAALGFYLGKTVVPVDLAPFYPLPIAVRPLEPQYWGSLVLIAVLTLASLRLLRKLPVLAATWAYYVISLLPVLGIVQVGSQAAADRYMYLAILGPLILAGAAIAKAADGLDASRRKRWMPVAVAAICVVAAALSALTVQQTRIWKDTLTLYSYVIGKFPESPKFYAGRANYFMNAGRPEEAIADVSKVIEFNARHPERAEVGKLDFHVLRATAHHALQQYAEAARDYSAALARDPGNADYLYNRGIAHANLGRSEAAIADYRRAIAIRPDFASAHNNLGIALAKRGDPAAAMESFDTALSLAPDEGSYYYNRGRIHELLGDHERARDDFGTAARLGDTRARRHPLISR